MTVNGVRIELQDGSWGLVRASSNKPELVIVAESPTSEETMQAILKAIELELSSYPEVAACAWPHRVAALRATPGAMSAARGPLVQSPFTVGKDGHRV